MISFNKFKIKILIEKLLKSIFIGLSISLLVFSIPLIYIKLKGIEFKIIYLLLLSNLAFVLVTGLVFLILKPNKMKVAKRLDKELNMNEKVQTMIEFENEEGFMIELQREDTLNILSNTSVKKLSLRVSIIGIILLVVSFASCITAVAIPKYTEPTQTVIPTIDPTYEADDWTIVAIRNIIAEVNASKADDSLKTKYVSMLEALIVELENNIDTESKLKSYVTEMISDILIELDKINTNNEVFMVLKDSTNSLVTSLAVEINLLDTADIRKQIENISALIYGSKEAIEEFHNDFGVILRSSNLNKEDELYKTLFKLYEDIYVAKDAENVRDAVDAAIYNNIENILSVVNLQAENYRIAHYIEFELNAIFGLNEPTKEPTDEGDEDIITENPYEEDKKEDENINNSGGLGSGDVLFGSDDAFFDPEKGIVEYGDVITMYYGEILGKLNEGILDESVREFFERYYDMLLGGDKFDEE